MSPREAPRGLADAFLSPPREELLPLPPQLALCCQRSPRTPGPPRHSIQFISSCGCSSHSLPGPRALRPPPGLAGLWLGAGTSLAAHAAASPASASSLTGLVGHSVGCSSFPCSHVLPSLSGPVCAGCWHWGHGHSGIRPRGGSGGLLLGRVQLGRLWPSLLVRGRQGRLTPTPWVPAVAPLGRKGGAVGGAGDSQGPAWVAHSSPCPGVGCSPAALTVP